MQKRIINIFGIIIILISFIYIVRNVVSLNINYSELLTPTNILSIIIMPFVSVVVIFLNAYCWRMMLLLFTNTNIPVWKTFSVYAKSNIMKYLPGNIGHYAGRQLFGTRLGISQIQLVMASAFEIIYSVAAMLLCIFLFSADMVFRVIQSFLFMEEYTCIRIIGIFTLLTVILLVFLFREHEYIVTLFRLLKSITFAKSILQSILLFAFGSTILILEYAILLNQYVTLDIQLMLILVSANFFATFIGFITPGVPGGIGVREATLLTVLLSTFSDDIIILTAIIYRVIMILGDIVTVFVSNLFIIKNATIKNKPKY